MPGTQSRASPSPHHLPIVASCAASHTSGSNSSTSSQRIFWTRVPRTAVWLCASTCASDPFLSFSPFCVIFPSTIAIRSEPSNSARRCAYSRLDWSSEPPRIRTAMPGLWTRSSSVATAARKVFPPPRFAHTTASEPATPVRTPAFAGRPACAPSKNAWHR